MCVSLYMYICVCACLCAWVLVVVVTTSSCGTCRNEGHICTDWLHFQLPVLVSAFKYLHGAILVLVPICPYQNNYYKNTNQHLKTRAIKIANTKNVPWKMGSDWTKRGISSECIFGWYTTLRSTVPVVESFSYLQIDQNGASAHMPGNSSLAQQ